MLQCLIWRCGFVCICDDFICGPKFVDVGIEPILKIIYIINKLIEYNVQFASCSKKHNPLQYCKIPLV